MFSAMLIFQDWSSRAPETLFTPTAEDGEPICQRESGLIPPENEYSNNFISQ